MKATCTMSCEITSLSAKFDVIFYLLSALLILKHASRLNIIPRPLKINLQIQHKKPS